MNLMLKISSCLLVLILLDIVMGAYLDRLYNENECDHANGELVQYLSCNETPDTLLIGSSRVLNMIDPSGIGPNVHSLAKPASHFFYHVALIDILAQFKRLPRKTIVLNVSLEDMYLENDEFLMEDLHYLKYHYGKNEFVTENLNREDPLNRVYYLPRTSKFNGDNFKLLTNHWQNICHPARQFVGLKSSEYDWKRVKSGINELRRKSYEELNPRFFEMLRHVEELCKTHSVKLVLLSGINIMEVDCIKRAAERLKQESQAREFRFIDFQKHRKPGEFPDSVWVDYIHLNGQAALKYTRRIKELLHQQ